MPVEAIVFMVVEPQAVTEIPKRLKDIEEVKQVFEVTGDYDFVIMMEGESYSDIAKILREKILKIPGVLRTTTSFIVAKHK